MVKITQQTIECNFDAKPDVSINIIKVKEHFTKYPERWTTVFKFLEETDLKTLDPGRIDLSEDVFMAVGEYETKNREDVLFESHEKYIDLQYVISGEELIGLTNDHTIKITTPYSSVKDITFYEFDGGKLLPASPENYFIFFPEDIHQPGVTAKQKSRVKKLVFKVKVDD
jgi:YhcH/YjgK/YiaL family protein